MTDELHYRAMEMANQRFLAALLQELRNIQKRGMGEVRHGKTSRP